MKRNWDISELIEQWTLIPRELALLDNKDTSSHLGFAVWLKFFQIEGHFPNSSQEIPKVAIRYIAQQLRTDPEGYNNYDWQGRLGRYHRTQILKFYGFRRPRATDIDQLIQWLHQNILPQTLDLKSVKNTASEWFRSLCLTPPPAKRFERTIRSAIRTYEAEFCADIFTKLSPASCTAMDQLLESHEGEESASNEEQAKELRASLFRFLNNAPGATNLDSLVQEITKLKCLRQMGLPEDLFSSNSLKIVTTYRNRAATAQSWELRRHPESIRYTLLAAFCWQRSQEVTDNLVELLIQLVHKLSSKAERRVTKELIQDFKRVSGKTQLLYHLAKAALNNPEGKVQDVVYPIASPETLQQLIREFESTGASYRQKVHMVTCRSYKHYYRRMVPQILEMLEFRSNNDAHQPVIQGINLLKKYADSRQQYYDSKEIIPLEGVLRSSWRDIFTSTDEGGNERIDRINYEIAVLQALRERLRCKEIWVMGANRYRNPEEDLPSDFEVRREDYYQALQQPTDVKEFISSVTQQMKQSMSELNEHISSNSKVTLLSKRNGWIKISPLAAQAEPVNLLHLRTELIRRWPMTGLLDILKETDLRVGFTECFQTTAIRETLDRSTLQKRLLLCLYGLGTNTGLKSISNSIPDVSRHELRHVKRRFIHKDQLRQAIIKVINATFEARMSSVWGEGTVACASDSKKFGAWDQNLTTEWHVRYGGRGVAVYWHVEKKSTCIYSQLKTCSSSEVAAMIEGVLRHDTQMNLQKNYVDTHGQSEIAFAFCHLLGFELLPRLKGIYAQKLYRPESGNPDTYPNLQLILTRPIKWDLIAQQYDQMIKYATALRLGTAEPEVILRRFTRGNLKHPTYQALAELGKVMKTIFLCHYLNSEALRQEINEGLNVVESWNSANSFIFYGKSSEISSNNRTEQELAVLSLHLLQMCLVYINTLMIQQVLAEPEWTQRLTQEDQRGLTPLIYGHVNPYGTFRLDLSERLAIEKTA